MALRLQARLQTGCALVRADGGGRKVLAGFVTAQRLQARLQTGCALVRADGGWREVLAGFVTAQQFLLACLAVTTFAAPAMAQTGGDQLARAELLDVEASGAFDTGRYQEALNAWRQAYALHPNHLVAWNIARSYEELHDLFAARSAFDVFLTFDTVPDEARKKGEEKIALLDQQIRRWTELMESAERQLEQGQCDEAVASWNEADELHKAERRHDWDRVRCLEKLDRTPEVAAAYRDMLSAGNLDEGERLGVLARLRAIEDAEVQGRYRIAGYTLAGLSLASFAVAGLSFWNTLDDIDELETLEGLPGTDANLSRYRTLSDRVFAWRTAGYVSLAAGVFFGVGSGLSLYQGFADSAAETASVGVASDRVVIRLRF